MSLEFRIEVYKLSPAILDPNNKTLANEPIDIDKIKKIADEFKFDGAQRVIRLKSLEQLPLIE